MIDRLILVQFHERVQNFDQIEANRGGGEGLIIWDLP